MPDPSAVWCKETYGNWERVKSDKGEWGVCRLPDGQLWEAWTLYRKHLKEQDAVS